MSGSGDEGSWIAKVGAALFTLIAGALGLFAGGWGTLFGNLLAVGAAICGLAFSVLYQRYQGVLAASELPSFKDGKFSPERAGYDKLRRSLADETAIARIYAKRLTGFLDWIERFFGDEGQADRSLFPHAFGLQTPAPLWTAPAFDRCLLLALLYPILTIVLFWGISGHVGPAEAALKLPKGLHEWQRGLPLLALAAAIFAYWRSMRSSGWKRWVWLAFAFAFAGAVAGAFAVAGAVAVAVAGAILFINERAEEGGWQGIFLVLFFLVMSACCLAAPYWLASLQRWDASGPLLLFLGLLTLINAPFDWLSLGLTRALLRRGLELKGWWPLLLALIDAALAVLIVAALSIAMILGIQAFDGAAVLGGGTATLSVADVLAGIGNPQTAGEPEYWWVYALLLSTMIPSMINLAIGGMALMRGIPALRPMLLCQLPANTHVSKDERKWIALLLAFQDVIGVILGILAQALIFWLLFAHMLPWFGLGLLEMANDIAALDLPLHVLSALLSGF